MADKKDDKPDTKPTPQKDDIPMHKKLAMGQKPDTGSGSGPKTPA